MSLTIADLSEFQGTVDWAAYGAANPAVIVRAHNGSRPDFRWAANLAGARAHCRWRGWYQYLNAGQDAAGAARALRATVGPLLPGEVYILDLEAGDGDQRGRQQAWYDALGVRPAWTYSGLSFAAAHLPGVRLDWVAAYGQSEPTVAHTLWQFSDRQRFAGIAAPCDASTYGGTLEQLLALTGHTTTTTGADMPLNADDLAQIRKAVSEEVAKVSVSQGYAGAADANAMLGKGYRQAMTDAAKAAIGAALAAQPAGQAVNVDALAAAVAAKLVAGTTVTVTGSLGPKP